jgi:hypothetical protein
MGKIMSCPYATALGERGKGFHSTRILGMAAGDIAGTIGLAYITTKVSKVDFLPALAGWFILGELMHYYYCVDTAFLEMIGIKNGRAPSV